MKKLTLFLASILTMLNIGLVLSPALALAETPKEAACSGLELTGGGCDSGDPNDPNSSGSQINSVLATAINIFSFIVGFAAVIMVIVGGFKYITSAGDSASTSSAKNTILYAVIGLVIVAMAQVIVRFVLDQF
jgi:hypothetical protein